MKREMKKKLEVFKSELQDNVFAADEKPESTNEIKFVCGDLKHEEFLSTEKIIEILTKEKKSYLNIPLGEKENKYFLVSKD